MNKYRNQKINYRGIIFDSKLEYNCYLYLDSLLKVSKIASLKLQVAFQLQDKFTSNQGKKVREVKYIADFIINDELIIDVKGKKTAVFIIKEKLLNKMLSDNNSKKEFYCIFNIEQLQLLLYNKYKII